MSLQTFLILLVIVKVQASDRIIYNLNDTEYIRLPVLYELDRYSTCLKNTDDVYCTLKLELFSERPNDNYTLMVEYSNHISKHYNYSQIERGICVHKRCNKFLKSKPLAKTEDLETILEACMEDIMWNEYGLHSKIQSYTCDKHNEETKTDIYDWIVLIIVLVLLGLNIAGTVYDFFNSRRTCEKNNNGFGNYLLCFSISRNWNWLVSPASDDPRLRKLKGLNGMRCILMSIFIISHTYYLYHGYTENPHQLEKFYDYKFYRVFFNGLPITQMLITISGFLLVYNLLMEAEKRPITWKMVPKIILLRLWRLTSANAVFVLLTATWLRHLGSGPLWKSFVIEKMSGHCRSYWWSHLLYVNNYITENRFCVIQSWQLAADVQLFIAGLCVWVATKSQTRVRVLSLLALLGVAVTAAHIWWEDMDPFIMLTPQFYRSLENRAHAVHRFTHVNISGFAVGMLIGHAIYQIQKSNVNFSKYSWSLATVTNNLILLLVLLFYTGAYFYRDGDRASLTLRVIYGAAIRPITAVVTGFSLLATVMRFGEFWSNLMEWDGWTVPARLTYSVSLVHTTFIALLYGTKTQLTQVSVLHHMITSFGIGVLSFLAAVPYCLLIEAPLNILIKKISNRDAIRHVKKVK